MVVSRSRAAAPAKVRSLALAAATRLFAAHGYGGTALQDIADAVGVSKQAILHHFASKEQLRDAVFETILGHWQETLPRLLVAATASHDRFDAVLGEVQRFFAADPDRARLLVREAMDRPAAMQRILRDVVKPWVTAVAKYIREGQARGQHHADVDPEAFVVHVLHVVIGATALAGVASVAVEPGAAGRARYERELTRIAKAALFTESESARGKRAKR